MEAVGAEVIFGMTGSTDGFSDYWKKHWLAVWLMVNNTHNLSFISDYFAINSSKRLLFYRNLLILHPIY